jgi:metal-responsive CopG/Arc/MetJ family transcriptional regulator
MKTAISIPQKVFETAEKLATKMGMSRSQLYVTAIKSYVEAHEGEAITAKLNEVYSQVDSKLDPKLKKLQAKAISRNRW